MTIQAPAILNTFSLPEVYSDRPIMSWATLGVDFNLNENVTFINPSKGVAQRSGFRVINCKVDLTNPAGTAIVYVGIGGVQMIYIPQYSGWHPIMGYGIVSVAAGVNSATLQVGI